MKLSANNFVKNPSLPRGQAVLGVAAGDLPESIVSAFSELGVALIKTQPDLSLDAPVKYHPDMLLFHLGNNKIILSPSQEKLQNELVGLGFETEVSAPLKKKYPFDIALNFLRIEKYIFGKKDFADKKIKTFAEENRLEFMNTNQGYARCSVCLVSRNAAITEDESLYKALTEKGIDVLKIRKGFVELEGYSCGFIGGASGKIARDAVAFFGDISLHPDFESIKSFLGKYGCKAVSLSSEPLRDYGGFIPILEK